MLSLVMRLVDLGYKAARRIVVAVVGASVVLVGVAMLVLPGPALLVIPSGLAILAIEFAWARRLLKRVREQGEEVWRSLGNGGREHANADEPDGAAPATRLSPRRSAPRTGGS